MTWAGAPVGAIGSRPLPPDNPWVGDLEMGDLETPTDRPLGSETPARGQAAPSLGQGGIG